MALSDDEQRVLENIENELCDQDPEFAERVGGDPLGTSTAARRTRAAILFVGGLVLMIVAMTLPADKIASVVLLCILGFLAMFAGLMYAIKGPWINANSGDHQ
jgi:hypothetical protein